MPPCSEIQTRGLIHEYLFPKDIAVKDAVLNDMQIDVTRNRIYITDTNPLGRKGSLIVYDIQRKRARRTLEGTPSVTGGEGNVLIQKFREAGLPKPALAYEVCQDCQCPYSQENRKAPCR